MLQNQYNVGGAAGFGDVRQLHKVWCRVQQKN